MSTKWRSAITHNFGAKQIPHIRGRSLLEMIKNSSFTESIFLLLKGQSPTAKEAEMLDAILTTGIDHGLGPLSTQSARLVASGGNSLHVAVAAGILALGDYHGGAIEQCARLLQKNAQNTNSKIKELATQIVAREIKAGRRLPGYGHKFYTGSDPRSQALIKKARALGFNGRYLKTALAIEKALEQAKGRKFPINPDGVIAALISEMGFDWQLGKGFYVIARTPGLVAHVYEEMQNEKPVSKRLNKEDIEYYGPKPH